MEVLVISYCCSSYGASAPWVLSLVPPLGTLCLVQWLAESIHLCICQALAEPIRRQTYQAPVSMHFLASTIVSRFGDCIWDGSPGWTVYAPHFVSVFLPVRILFPLLRSTEASTFWSSFFLGFVWSLNRILGIPNFWANIHLSVSTYCVCFYVTESPHSG